MTAGARVAEELDALLEVTDVGEAFWALGRSYGTVTKALRRHGRLDLVEKLSQWKSQDNERLSHAQGRSWW